LNELFAQMAGIIDRSGPGKADRATAEAAEHGE